MSSSTFIRSSRGLRSAGRTRSLEAILGDLADATKNAGSEQEKPRSCMVW